MPDGLTEIAFEAPRSTKPGWLLVERYGNNHEGWWLVFRRGDLVVEFDVHEDAWRAFDRAEANA